MDEALDTLGRTIADALSASVKSYAVAHHELTLEAQARDIVAVMRFLRDDPRCLFWNIIDVTAIDWPGRDPRFDVVYHLLSPKHNVRIRVKVAVEEGASVDSAIGVFPGVDWFEREVFDLYGIPFTGHGQFGPWMMPQWQARGCMIRSSLSSATSMRNWRGASTRAPAGVS